MTTDTNDTDDEYTLDDEFEYAGWRIGRPTRTAEVDALDGTDTIEEGVLTCELVTKDQLREAKLDGEWMATSSRRTAVWVSASTTATAAAWRCRTTWKRQSRSQRP